MPLMMLREVLQDQGREGAGTRPGKEPARVSSQPETRFCPVPLGAQRAPQTGARREVRAFCSPCQSAIGSGLPGSAASGRGRSLEQRPLGGQYGDLRAAPPVSTASSAKGQPANSRSHTPYWDPHCSSPVPL